MHAVREQTVEIVVRLSDQEAGLLLVALDTAVRQLRTRKNFHDVVHLEELVAELRTALFPKESGE
jgi:hypothetical protein